MSKLFFVIPFILFPSIVLGQVRYFLLEAATEESQLVFVPDSITQVDEIAHFLTKDLLMEEEKALQIYKWVCQQIKYDTEFEYYLYGNSEERLLKHVLKQRSGVCAHFSILFHALSKSVGLETYLIEGFSKPSMPGAGHAWNGIKIEGHFYLVDCTWGAGYVMEGTFYPSYSEEYFLVNPDVFIADHFPFDPMWQFLDAPLSVANFIHAEYSGANEAAYFNFQDSLVDYLQYDRLKRAEGSYKRMKAMGGDHPRWVSYLISQNRIWVNGRINEVVGLYNSFVVDYNRFVDSRRHSFRKPKMEDEEIALLLKTMASSLASMKLQLGDLQAEEDVFQLQIRELLAEIQLLEADFKKQQAFADRYLAKGKFFRWMMF